MAGLKKENNYIKSEGNYIVKKRENSVNVEAIKMIWKDHKIMQTCKHLRSGQLAHATGSISAMADFILILEHYL